ncbi:MAG: GTP cyclohydrolase II [bacterium]
MLKKIITTSLPTRYGDFELHLYHDNLEKEYLALVCGDLKDIQKPILTRIHSACLTGEVFGSLRCDCQEQLHESMQKIQDNSSGVLIYLNQEGRGIGLTNKIKAYALQSQGLDTVEANEKLGFKPDERDFMVAGEILKDLGVEHVKLMTNHPQKIADLEKKGIKVERQKLWVGKNKNNQKYLLTKQIKMGHLN